MDIKACFDSISHINFGGLDGELLKEDCTLANVSLGDFYSRRDGLYPEDYVAEDIELPEEYDDDDIMAHHNAVIKWLDVAGDILKTIAYSGEDLPDEVKLPNGAYEFLARAWVIIRDIEDEIVC